MKTIKIRACVGINSEGKWYVYGLEGDNDSGMKDAVYDCEYEPIAFLEAEIPLPELQTVEASVAGSNSERRQQ